MSLRLKPYKARPTERGIGLRCPRKECDGKFIINMEKLSKEKAERGIKTITCPYCSKVSLIPNGYRLD